MLPVPETTMPLALLVKLMFPVPPTDSARKLTLGCIVMTPSPPLPVRSLNVMLVVACISTLAVCASSVRS